MSPHSALAKSCRCNTFEFHTQQPTPDFCTRRTPLKVVDRFVLSTLGATMAVESPVLMRSP
eukprot:3493742-Amphidinium_carterae.2